MKLTKNTLNNKIIEFNKCTSKRGALGFDIKTPYTDKLFTSVHRMAIVHNLLIDLDCIYNNPYKETSKIENYIRYNEYE